MVEFQSRTGAIEINEQAKSVIKSIERVNAKNPGKGIGT